jgi:two-component system LytT family sensor kinase
MEEKRLRFWENWIVFGALMLFVIRATQKLSNRFLHDLEIVEHNGFSYDFDIRWNLYLPFIGFALLAYFSWIIFHNYAYPNFKERPKNPVSTYYFLLCVALAFSAVYVYHYYRQYWEVFTNPDSDIDTLLFSYWSRKVFLAANTILVLWIIFAYEGFSVLFYKICNRLRKEGAMYSLIINFIFGLSILVFVFFVGKSADYVSSMLFPSINPYVNVLIVGVPVAFCQNLFYQSLKSWKGYSVFMMTVFILLVISALAVFTDQFIEEAYNYNWSPPFSNFLNNTNEISFRVLMLVIVALAIGLLRFGIYRRNNKLEREVVQKSAELDQLRTQVNPHFLFNALNTLYSVSLKENAETTAVGIQKLGDMMRFMLNENNQDFIPLSSEIEQLENYILIQRMRLDESQDIEVSVNIQYPEKQIFVAPMLLNPFVENAFKHGISFRSPSWIHITLSFDSDRLYFKVHNSLHKILDFDTERNNNGIGLENVKKRLAIIYPDKHNLEIVNSEQDFFVSLEILYN